MWVAPSFRVLCPQARAPRSRPAASSSQYTRKERGTIFPSPTMQLMSFYMSYRLPPVLRLHMHIPGPLSHVQAPVVFSSLVHFSTRAKEAQLPFASPKTSLWTERLTQLVII